MDSRWRIYQIQLGFSIFFCAGRVKEEVMNIWTRVNGSTTENVWALSCYSCQSNAAYGLCRSSFDKTAIWKNVSSS